MEFTGERYMTTEGGVMAYEHWHRYAHVARWVQGKRVLDAACGEGYGSAFLARSAESVLGVDVDPKAVSYAAGLYGSIGNLSYKQTDILDLKPEDGQFDVIVSFETLEHVPDQNALMDAFRNLLVPGGLLIISTPDKDVYSGKYGHQNEFHVRELTAAEFEAACRSRFKTVRILGQRGYVASVIGDRTAASGKVDMFGGSPNGPAPTVPSVVEALYLIAFCSDNSIKPEPGATSFFIDNDPSVQEERSVIEGWAQSLNRELEALKATSAEEQERAANQLDVLDLALRTSQASLNKLEADNSRLDGLAGKLDEIEDGLTKRTSPNSIALRIDDIIGRLDKIELRLTDDAMYRAQAKVIDSLVERIERWDVDNQQACVQTGNANRTLETKIDRLVDDSKRAGAATTAMIADAEARILVAQSRAQQTYQGNLSRLVHDMETVSNAVDQDRVYFASLLTGLQMSIDALAVPAAPLAPLNVIHRTGAGATQFWQTITDRHGGRTPLFRKKKSKHRDTLAKRVLSSGLFAPDWYSAQVGRSLSEAEAVWHFVTEGLAHNLSPHPLFDPQWYLINNPDVDDAGVPAFLHYIENGWRENRAPHPLFDPEFYRLQTFVEEEPVGHFLRQPGHESDPHADFGIGDYRRQRPDLAAPQINPLVHYITRGRDEGLATFPSPFVNHG